MYFYAGTKRSRFRKLIPRSVAKSLRVCARSSRRTHNTHVRRMLKNVHAIDDGMD